MNSAAVVLATGVLWFVVLRVMSVIGPGYGAAVLAFGLLLLVGLIRPPLGLALLIPLAIVGDAVAMPWWPVIKNLSSSESILYTANQLKVKPAEIMLLAVAAVWLTVRWVGRREKPLVYGVFWGPLLVFTVTIVLGLVWGVGRGGDFRIAIFEAAPLLYIPIVYLLAVNLFTSIGQYHRVIWGVMAALTFEAIHTWVVLSSLRENIPDDASPLEHTAALHMNLVFLMLVGSIWFGTKRIGLRLLLVIITVPTLFIYLDAERRAAVVGLIIGGLFLAGVLFSRDRAKFKRVVPAMMVFALLYCGAFWNVETGIGFPAQAIKIILVPDASAEADASSDLYREIENFDLNATIRGNPVLGVGFGQPFDQPIPLPDISFFEFWEYIPHNSVLWMWLKVGIVGFLAFLYLVALAIARGVRSAAEAEDPDDARMISTVAAFVPMTFVVAFVDITFDGQTTVLLGFALAMLASIDRFRADEAVVDLAEDQAVVEEPA